MAQKHLNTYNVELDERCDRDPTRYFLVKIFSLEMISGCVVRVQVCMFLLKPDVQVSADLKFYVDQCC